MDKCSLYLLWARGRQKWQINSERTSKLTVSHHLPLSWHKLYQAASWLDWPCPCYLCIFILHLDQLLLLQSIHKLNSCMQQSSTVSMEIYDQVSTNLLDILFVVPSFPWTLHMQGGGDEIQFSFVSHNECGEKHQNTNCLLLALNLIANVLRPFLSFPLIFFLHIFRYLRGKARSLFQWDLEKDKKLQTQFLVFLMLYKWEKYSDCHRGRGTWDWQLTLKSSTRAAISLSTIKKTGTQDALLLFFSKTDYHKQKFFRVYTDYYLKSGNTVVLYTFTSWQIKNIHLVLLPNVL